MYMVSLQRLNTILLTLTSFTINVNIQISKLSPPCYQPCKTNFLVESRDVTGERSCKHCAVFYVTALGKQSVGLVYPHLILYTSIPTIVLRIQAYLHDISLQKGFSIFTLKQYVHHILITKLLGFKQVTIYDRNHRTVCQYMQKVINAIYHVHAIRVMYYLIKEWLGYCFNTITNITRR